MKFALSTLLLLSPLSGSEQKSEDHNVSSLEASYEQGTLLLKGEVRVEHGLGILESGQAVLRKEDGDNTLPFSSVFLEEEVNILCTDNTSLRCDVADLNFVDLKGTLLSSGTTRVVYSDPRAGSPFRIESKEVNLSFERAGTANNPQYFCKEVLGSGEVRLLYDEQFGIESDFVLYQTNGGEQPSGLSAYPSSDGGRCKLTHQGEELQATRIEIDRERSLIRIRHPIGSVRSSLFSDSPDGRISIRCEDLLWDRQKNTLLLSKGVELEETSFGHLATDETVLMKQTKRKSSHGSLGIESIRVEGKSVLSRDDSSLTCYGTLRMDGIKRQVTGSKPAEAGSDLRILYRNPEMELRADEACLDYTEPSYEVSSLTFRGSVQISSRDPDKPGKCALADRASYTPETATVILSAHPGKRVLFRDEEQGLNMSAKEVHITRNAGTGKADVKGIGNVKLSLSEEEEQRLRNRFPGREEKHVSD